MSIKDNSITRALKNMYYGAAIKTKRPFVMKVGEMSNKIPKNALDEEKSHLNSFCAAAYIYQQIQESFANQSKSFENQYSKIKKGTIPQDAELTFYGEQNIWDNIGEITDDVKKAFDKDITDNITKAGFMTHWETYRNNLSKLNNAEAKDPQEIKELLQNLKQVVLDCKKLATLYRSKKIEEKNKFKDYLKKVNEGIKLSKKIKNDMDWGKYKTKITAERLMKMQNRE